MHINSALALLLGAFFSLPGYARICNPMKEKCWLSKGNSTSSPAYPSRSSTIRLNPSAVPVDRGWGGETLFYDGGLEFGLVKGLGRVGAAVSLANGEESFFGPPGFELDEDRLERMRKSDKYESQKMTAATAVNVLNNKQSGLRKFQINLGVIGKYNKQTKGFWPGGGLSGIVGPLTFGYSAAQDEYLIPYSSSLLYVPGTPDEKFRYWTETYSVGIFLSSVAIDYSYLKVHTKYDYTDADVSLLTGSLLLNRWIFTLAGRRESSQRYAYNFKIKDFEYELDKRETFAGVQFAPTKVLLVGIFHNYYLLRELSLGLTLFF